MAEVCILWRGELDPELEAIYGTRRAALKAMLRANFNRWQERFDDSRRYGRKEFGEHWDRWLRNRREFHVSGPHEVGL